MSWYGVDIFTRATEIFGDDMAFRRCGYVVGVAENNVKPLEANIEMMQGLGIATELISHDKMAELWPGLNLDDFACSPTNRSAVAARPTWREWRSVQRHVGWA